MIVRRVLSVWFPTFSTDLVGRRLLRSAGPPDRADGGEPSRAILLTRAVGGRELIARRCARAAMSGVAVGMDLTHARSLLGEEPHVEPHRPDREAAALHALACRALRFSPMVAPDPPDGLVLDISGTERLHRGEARVIRAVAAGAARMGFPSRVAAAPTFACAWGVARFGMHDLARVPDGRQREAVAKLPVAALRVDDRIIHGLAEIGITTVGQVLDLPRASVRARFDPTLLQRVDMALGRAPESIEPVRPTPPARAALLFDGPTDRWESIEAAARQVLGELAEELARRERGVRRLDLELLRPHADPARVEISLSRPSRSVKHLWSLVRSRLERLDLDSGVEGVVYTAARTARLRHEQASSPSLGASTEHATAAAWGELADTLVTRLGADRVVWIDPVESHLPERSFRERSVMSENGRGAAGVLIGADRPTVLFDRPEPAEVISLTPDGPLLSLRWRGRQVRIIDTIGPERIGPEWWRWGAGEPGVPSRRRQGRPPDRDYYAAQTETGRWLWVCRQVDRGKWYVHGEWS